MTLRINDQILTPSQLLVAALTTGDRSGGVIAQSLGGGGGNGGFNVTGGINLAGTGTGGANIGVGGMGGNGGIAGNTLADITGGIATTGEFSNALVVQSVGGGGGNGGFNVSGTLSISKNAGALSVGIGGFGGDGGAAGTARLDLNQRTTDAGNTLAAVSTINDDSSGIIVQSLGGGGGNGGFNVAGSMSFARGGAGNLGVGVGGFGGGGGDAAIATANVRGDIVTGGDRSGGLLVQSLGGGGGNGGFNVTGGIAGSKGGNGNIGIGIGGFGGDGGDGKAVFATIQSDIQTDGDGSYGANFQSLGGGGGNGGFNVTGGISASFGTTASGNFGLGIGGFGGGGGGGDAVTASLTGNVVTSGANSHGILIQSAGGGGGSGGFNVTGNISVSKGANGSVGIGIGGFGGDGGSGGIVNATLNGNVSTNGIKSYGALLQSVGGAGGAGGLDVSGNLSIAVSSGTSVAASLGIGGFGGAGGDGKAVTGSVTGQYVTLQDSSAGAIAQSVGGGGGQGGINVSGAIAISPGEAGTGSIGIGGFGGGGGNGGIVTFTRLGDTSTSGANSDGVVAQSVGGGGGAGGINVSGGIAAAKGTTAALGFGLGGFGGGGGYGEAVTAYVDGNVHATGIASDTIYPSVIVGQILGFGGDLVQEHRERLGGSNGVLVQSVGGGGGSGGLNVTGEIAFTKSADDSGRAASIGVGGFGGSGGDAGSATLYLGTLGHYEIVANGDGKDAVAVQSIGGGGGQGGVNVSGAISTEGQLVVGVGGFGGDGGISRAVYASVNADLWAAGNNSVGLLAQSVGGGGGQGGLNVSAGIVLSSGTKDPSVVFGLGGFGGVGNHADRVDAIQLGQVIVEGANATGVLIQSVGGGGGAGALNVSTSLSRATGDGKLDGIALAAGVGGTGGLGADAGNVTLDSNGLILMNSVVTVTGGVTSLAAADYALNAPGILVQSVGGGGGSGGINVSAAVAPKGAPMSVAVGGSGGAGGDAGTVSVVRGYTMVGGVETKTGSLINTFGDGSAGLIAQSIGGGGGNAGFNLGLAINKVPEDKSKIAANFAIGGDGGDAGEGKAVDVRHNGDIATHGAGSDGILAQSITKGGGNGNYNIGGGYTGNSSSLVFKLGGTGGNGGRAGDVTVTHEGIIETDGNNSAGIRGQSIGKGGGNSSTELGSNYGSSNTLNVQIGATGGAGGIAGNVTIGAAGFITTHQGNSDGIAAQSIGGGGSSGSIVVQGQVSSGQGKDKKANSVGVALGLEGGEGGVAGMVDVSSSAQIRTLGDMSRGIFAQSLGGDGGTGGSATGTIVGAANGASLAIGGGGGSGAIANRVHVDQSGLIITTGSQSDGILAQSVGGGGGAGGMASSYVIQKQAGTDGESTNTVSVAVGGGGGSAGTGGNVDVLNSGTIATTGDFGYGIRAQSIGGGGGVGGAVLSQLMQGKSASNEMSVLVGGAGGDGNTAGSVDVTNHGLIYTTGNNAAGISANSIGGGGGDAGVILSLQLSLLSEGETHRLDLAIGGNGGTGGTGGEVTVTNASTGGVNSGTIVTTGKDSYGILAQSIGGGGGNSSSIVTISASRGNKESSSLGINFGAKGGDGNTGGTVNVTNGSLIQTGGDGAHGVLAQSVGGGGGNGGLVLAGSLILSAPTSSPLISLGGVGGNGGDGGNVFVTNSGQILTTGAKANGILAQSIGGGGGNSSMGFSATGEPGSLILGNAISALMGAFGGGSGGTGGNVTVVHTGDITVTGNGSQAIVAQSINGGGGSLDLNFDGISSLPGFAYGGSTANGGHVDPLMVINAGGDGSNGMNAGKVSVTSNGTIGVGGKNAVAISLQAIGGGGGTINLHGLVVQRPQDIEPGSGQQAVRVAATLGGKNGADNDGGDIDGIQTGSITTFNDSTAGLELQSIGGGGGKVFVDMESADLGLLDGAAISLGATGEIGSQGGAIDRQQSGLIQTFGNFAPGAVIQSIGGGGGIANVSFAQIQPALVTPAGGGVQHLAVVSSQSAGGLTNLSLGSSGGSGNNGGAIMQSLSGGAMTLGNHSPALLLQSIGAGGGFASIAGDPAPTISLGGVNGAQGAGGAVTLLNNGLIATAGIGSHGVILQSIGGGGGAVFGDFSTANLTLNSANGGNGGIITFSQDGDIAAIGDQATALIAQSLGGGGGFVDGVFAGTAGGVGRGGAIGLDINGGIIAYGLNSTAVMAQSLGSLGASNIIIGATGDVRGGSGTGRGIALDGGLNNVVTVDASLSAVSGLAITGTSGNDRLENNGFTVGNALLGGGDNVIHTALGATFMTIDTLDLRDGVSSSGLFNVDGNLLMGLSASRYPIDLLAGDTFAIPASANPQTDIFYGTRVISQVALDGNFVQSATGHSNFDVAFGPYASDRFNVTGDAIVDGRMTTTLMWLENNHPLTLFATDGIGIDLGMKVDDTLAINYRLLASDIGIQLAFNSNFGQPFLTENEQALGGSLDSAVKVGGAAGIGRLLALLGNLTTGQEQLYSDIMAELDPELFGAPMLGQFDAARDFGNGLFGCNALARKAGTTCVWTSAEKSRIDRDSDRGDMTYREHGTGRLRIGAEVPAGNGWSFGGSLGYDDISDMRFNTDRATGSGSAIHGGIGIRKDIDSAGRATASLKLSGGIQWNDMSRRQSVFVDGIGHANYKSSYYGVSTNVGYTFDMGNLFARPELDASLFNIGLHGFEETGLGGLGIQGVAHRNWISTASPKLTLGALIGKGARFSVTGGAVIHDRSSLAATYRMLGADDASDPALIRTRFDHSAWLAGADLTIAASTGVSVDLGYHGEIGKSVESHDFRAKVKIAF
ncbi:MAG: autotransporter outer membrane beta-barrel domain-containing protein [Sphingomicrobium sp.]